MAEERLILRGTRLDELFERWEATYTSEQRAGFHRDGAMDEATYYAEPRRVLFVQVEPNSRDGAYKRFYGHDLRLVFPQIPAKANTVQMAVFAGMALNRTVPVERPGPAEVEGLLRRFACINLKKLAGRSAADKREIAEYAWRDRSLLREQIQLLAPHVILAGGPNVQTQIGKVLLDDPGWTAKRGHPWQWGQVPVLATYHPSVRPYLFWTAVSALAKQLGIPQAAAGVVSGRDPAVLPGCE
jgi:hypothetical protein